MNLEHATPELFAALATAQGAVEGAKKDATGQVGNVKEGTGRKYQYADLAAVIEAAQKPLRDAGLSLTFSIGHDPTGILVTPLLAHKTGGYIVYDGLRVPCEAKAQAQGSAMTYGRRYLTMSILGIPAEDDDGASSEPQKPAPRPAATAAKPEASKAVTPEEAAFKGRLKAVTAYLVDNKPVLTKAQADELREALHKAKTVDALDAVQKACGECLVLNAQANAVAAGMGGTVE